MTPIELRALANEVNQLYSDTRPDALKNDLMWKIKDCAKSGKYFIDFMFVDQQHIIDIVVQDLKQEGFTVDLLDGGAVRIGW